MKIELTRPLGPGLQDVPEDSVAYLYHENSKLSPNAARRLSASFSMTHSELFLASRPFRQQRFAEAHPLHLDEGEHPGSALADLLFSRRSQHALSGDVPFATLSRLLNMSLGATAIVPTEQEGISQLRRAWPSAGALYPLDTYVLAQHIDGLTEGLYSLNVPAAQLELLPCRDVASVLNEGFFHQSWVNSAAAVILLVGVMERTLSKYGDRGYRLIMLDAGHAGQNLLLSAHALGLGACAIGGFNDNGLANDLSIDGSHEVVVHAVAVGGMQDVTEPL
jgi:SagB-type dehydrogenase family enzyme